MLKIVSYIAKFGREAATKKFGSAEVKQALAGKAKSKPKPKAPKKPTPSSPTTNKPKPKPKATQKPGKPGNSKSKDVGDFLVEMFGRKRTGKTPRRSDSQAYRDGLKAGQKKADEKLNPSLRNKDMKPRSISNRKSDVAEQLRDIKKAGGSPKDVARLEARLRNLKDMAKDRPDLTTMRGRFSGGGLATHTDMRTTGLFSAPKTSPRPTSRGDAKDAAAVKRGNNEARLRAEEAKKEALRQRGKAIDEAISGIVNKPGKKK